MLGSLKEQRVLSLLDEAILQASTLGESSVAEIVSILEKTRRVLASPIRAERDVPLLLSAARWRVAHVEKYTVRRIVHDEVDGRVMSILVRLRVLCAEAIKMLDLALDELRMSRERHRR
jgi:hypothetical protein